MAYLPDGRTFEMSHELLRGAIDIRVHPGPHLPSSPRRVDPFEAARGEDHPALRRRRQGRRETGTVKRVRRAIALHIEGLRADGLDVPEPTTTVTTSAPRSTSATQ